MPAKILVIDSEAGRRTLRPALRQHRYDVLEATSGAEGFRRWQDESPDLVLVAESTATIDGYAVATQIRATEQLRHTPIIMVGAGGAVDQKVQGLRSGADDFLVTPLQPAELIARIRSLLPRVGAPEASAPEASVGRPRIGRVLAFYGAKGGVGTTTLAVNTAIALHRSVGRRVALLDAKLQYGDHRIFFDLALDRKSIIDAVSATSIDLDVLKQILVRTESGVDVLLAPPSPVAAELVTPDHIPQILSTLTSEYDYIVVDVDTRLDESTLRILDAADAILVVMTADLPCLKNVRLLLETIKQVGYDDSKVQLILNRSTAATGISPKHAEGALDRRINHRIINDYQRVMSSLQSGSPFASTRPDAAVARSIAAFAEAIDGSSASVSAQPPALVLGSGLDPRVAQRASTSRWMAARLGSRPSQ